MHTDAVYPAIVALGCLLGFSFFMLISGFIVVGGSWRNDINSRSFLIISWIVLLISTLLVISKAEEVFVV